MKKAWKWILGILIVLLVVAALVAVPLAMRSYMVTRVATNTQRQTPQNFNGGPMLGRGYPGNDQGRNPGGFNGRSGPMMGNGSGFNRGFNRGFAPFGFGLMFLGGLLRLIPLALFGLLLYGVYQLGKRSGLRTAAVAAVPAPASAAPIAADAPQDGQTPTP